MFLARARTSRMFRVICYYPSYAKRFRDVLDAVMVGKGPLPRDWRNYIAIMVRTYALFFFFFFPPSGTRSSCIAYWNAGC